MSKTSKDKQVPKYQTVDASTKCFRCKKRVTDHPFHPEFKYLFVLCNGSVVRIAKRVARNRLPPPGSG